MFRDKGHTIVRALLLLMVVVSGYAAAESAPVRPGDEVIVPDKFLRRWDPVTIFFDRSSGPEKGGPEDHPERFVTVTPAHPGAYTWLDAKTLQFRPAESWPPLTRFRWKAAGREQTLVTLVSAPSETLPADGATGLDPVERVTLVFPEPVEVKALAQMIMVELRPLPGVASDQSRWLNARDYSIKVVERSGRADQARYVLVFREPIPAGTHVTIHLRLSLEDRAEQAFQKIRFSTLAPFTVAGVGCAGQLYPITGDGVKYGREQALRCPEGRRSVDVTFSARLAAIDAVQARNLVRFTPAVEGLGFITTDNQLSITGKFQPDTLYRVNLEPTLLRDEKSRALRIAGRSELYLFFPRQPEFLKWTVGQGILERTGPQMVPLEGRGFSRLDLRVHKIDPLDRNFWPFPDPIVIDESKRPPGPGEEPASHNEPSVYITEHALRQQVAALGSPSVSRIVDLPLKKAAGRATFGLDLKPHLAQISGRDAPGTYLVGMRRLDRSDTRAWIRVQVTDLSLTAVEESDRVRFAVTSLSTGAPVDGATVSVEGAERDRWSTLANGTTDKQGLFDWSAPGYSRHSRYVRRIVVSKGNDRLVLDPSRPPESYSNGHWSARGDTWLQWAFGDLKDREGTTEQLCHLFTERPVYKPEEPVHVQGFVRTTHAGRLSVVTGKGTLVVFGPGDKEWRYPVQLTGAGSFYHKFDEEALPTGEYTAYFENGASSATAETAAGGDDPEGDDSEEYSESGSTVPSSGCGIIKFRKESYRLPSFEVKLNGPMNAGLDAPFKLLLNATYYAGGPVVNRPVRWRVTQFPYTWTPRKLEGFAYSTDARYSDEGFSASPAMSREGTTDAQGATEVALDPTVERTAQPRRYVVEATVIGADDQTVTNTHEVKVLPPFVLAMKLPRYIPSARSIDPEILVVGNDGKPLADQKVRLRLLRRQWASHLQAGDFTQGDAKYVTEVVDEPVMEKVLTSTRAPLKLSLPIAAAGVYLVEIESQDKLGRTQTLRLDLFAGGAEAVTWSRPPARVFTVTTAKEEYAPGETATFILQSPFQKAQALAVVEQPDGRNQYSWVNVVNGAGSFSLPVSKEYLPRLPVHFVLMRGRMNEEASASETLDLAKPATLAATAWLKVSPRENRVEVSLRYPEKAQPGDEITMDVTLSDHRGKPLAGEVTLWLVDQAVLALGKELRLDPLPDFVRERGTRAAIRDTRNLALGYLPLQEQPGGDGAARAAMAPELLDNVTIRKNFSPVPFYRPSIPVGPSGKVSLKVKLPDNLTNFKVRAKAVSGPDRFGVATGMIAVRLPVIVQPSLPRFVRPGDRFSATAIGRVVDGGGGPGRAQLRVDGLTLQGEADQRFVWNKAEAQRIDYGVAVPDPTYDAEGKPERESVTFTLGVERESDKARDAFSVVVPIRPDRRPVIRRQLKDLAPGQAFDLPAVTEEIRPGTLRRNLLLTDQPALVRMAAGLSYLMEYPYGCTEQRISKARVQLASKKFDALLAQAGNDKERARIVQETLVWMEGAVSDQGLVGYWPGSKGYVSLTAWAVQFMVEARNAGFSINGELLDRMTRALSQSLRSDYGYLVSGAEYEERTWALTALAAAGKLDTAYAAELARKSEYLDLESVALITRVLAGSRSAEPETLSRLNQRLWNGLVIRLYQGNEIYGGLQKTARTAPAQILPSETRTLSEVLRTVTVTQKEPDKRRQLLLNGLVTLGQGDGWGSTNSNAAALLALSEFVARGNSSPARDVPVDADGKRQMVRLGGSSPMTRLARRDGAAVRITAPAGATVGVRADTRYLPKADGSRVEALAQGFVLGRELLRYGRDESVPPERFKIDAPGRTFAFTTGDVVEEHVELVNPGDKTYVAVVIPIAAGMEPLNPALATAPPEAKPKGQLTLQPSYVAYADDQMAYYYDNLPKGTYHFYFRTRATIPGEYTQPAAFAEMMYKEEVNGNSNGAHVTIRAAKK